MSPSHLPRPRGIDHLVHAARDLDGLAQLYRALGFTVGARNRHPWGTENHIVQFDGAFIELISVGMGAAISPRVGRHYSFGAFVHDYIGGGDGLAMLALESHNAIADAESFRKARIGDFEPFHFERAGKNAKGEDARVAFSLAFAEMQDSPRAAFFLCQQHVPQNFWNAAMQHHSNAVSGISNVVLVAEDPSDAHEFLGAFTGQREMRATSFGLELETGRGRIDVLSPEAFRFRFNEAPPLAQPGGLAFAGISYRVASLDAALQCFKQGKIDYRQIDNRLVVSASSAYGVVLTFTT